MPHSPDDRRRAITRLRRIRGQAEALERAIESGNECAAILQQLAAMRGAVNGLMSDVLESHLRESFGSTAPVPASAEVIDTTVGLVRSYLR